MPSTGDNIGFCAVDITSIGGYTRWPIKACWCKSGEDTLQTLTAEAAARMQQATLSEPMLHRTIIRKWLIDLVADAAETLNTNVIPCRSYVLMQHLGRPCFAIDAGTRSVQVMETSSWREADQAIDAQEAADGSQYWHAKSDGTNLRVMFPFDPANPSIDPNTFHGTLAPIQQHFEQILGTSATKAR